MLDVDNIKKIIGETMTISDEVEINVDSIYEGDCGVVFETMDGRVWELCTKEEAVEHLTSSIFDDKEICYYSPTFLQSVINPDIPLVVYEILCNSDNGSALVELYDAFQENRSEIVLRIFSVESPAASLDSYDDINYSIQDDYIIIRIA